MTNEIKVILEYIKEGKIFLNSNECDILLDYITNLQEENERLNKTINKIKKLKNANTHIENIYYAEGVLLNEPYCDIEDVDNEELLDILRGDE